jgi:uncharacterized membrane protein
MVLVHYYSNIFMSQITVSSRKPFRRAVNYFLQGLLYVAPIGITVYVLYVLFGFVDGLLRSLIRYLFGLYIPGLGLVVVILLITLLGYAGQTVIAQPVKRRFTQMLKQVPFLMSIYTAIKDFFEAFVGKEKKFAHPVLVRVNRSADMEKIGFITQSNLMELNIKDKVAVYFPHSYNFSGELFIVPTENIRPLDIPPQDAMKFILTGGVTKIKESQPR